MKVKKFNDVTEKIFELHKNNTSNLLSISVLKASVTALYRPSII